MLFDRRTRDLSNSSLISGRKGSSGGSSKKGGSGSDASNTLRSKARASMIEAISEGEIVGLINGDQSIFFDQTPVKNADGTYNFKNVIWEEHKGLPDETAFKGVKGVETPFNVDVQVKQATGPVQRTIVDVNADALRMIMRIPALVKQDKDKGGLTTASVSYKIEIRNYGGSWTTAVQNDITNQKTTSPYQIAHRIELPEGGSPWDVRVTRLTPDSTDDTLQNETWWEGYVVIVDGKYIYPHTAAVAIQVNAEDMGQSIPARSFHVKGLKINVPSNYDPDTRTYTGIWDGTFKIAWTNNPAWVFYDLLVNDRYGLGEFVQAAIVDKWSLYVIAQYCDQLVPSGYKNGDTGADIMEPRFTYNGVINTRDEAYAVLQQITTAWRGMAFWSIGQVFATADMPSDPIKLVSPANVIDGNFEYSGTSKKSRHSVCLVKWNDPDDFYRPATEVVIDDEALRRWGWREKPLELNGCTSRGLAHRYGKWVLDVEQNETETVEYSASWDHADVRPGDIISISDPNKSSVRNSGRVVSHVGNVVTIDGDFEPAVGASYFLLLTMPDGSLEKKQIQSFSGRELTMHETFSTTALVNAMFAITGTDITPRQYRVLSVSEQEKNVFKITALTHDPNKFARVEQNIVFDPLPYSRPPNISLPPINLSVREISYTLNGTTHSRLHLSWSPNPNFMAREFHVSVQTPSDGIIDLGNTDATYTDLDGIEAGEYTFFVNSISYTGLMSAAAEAVYEASGPEGIPLPTVTNLRLTDRPSSSEFVGRDIPISWDNNFAGSSDPTVTDGALSSKASPLYSHNIIKIYNNATNGLLRTERVLGEHFVYRYDMNVADNQALSGDAPCRAVRFEVTVFDTFGRQSTDPAIAIFTNTPPAAIVPDYAVAGKTINCWFANIADEDFQGFLIWRSLTPGFDPSLVVPIHDISTTYLQIDNAADTTYYFRFAAYDAFGKIGLNISPEIVITTSSFEVDTKPPADPTGLALSTNIETVAGVAQRMILTMTVDAPIDDDFAYFDFEIKQNAGNYVSFPSGATPYEKTVLPLQTYKVRVSAVDQFGNRSGYSSEETIVTPDCPELADLINGGSVEIDGGKIRIQGDTLLSDWRNPGDLTTIYGGAIGTGTITADKGVFGLRGIAIDGIEFDFNKPAVNQLSWAAGSITYTDDTGTAVTKTVDAGFLTWDSGTQFVYYVQGASVLSSTTVVATAFNPNAVVLATYKGGNKLVANYGRTIIDGSTIKTGTITAAQADIDSFKANILTANAISSPMIQAGAITASKMVLSDTTNLIASPYFEDPDCWPGSNPKTSFAEWVYSPGNTVHYNGSDYRMNLTNSGVLYNSNKINVVPGDSFLIKGTVMNYSAGGGIPLYLVAMFYKSDGTTLTYGIVSWSPTDPHSYIERSASVTAPAGAAYCRVYFTANAGLTGYYIAGFVGLYRRSNASLLVDGSITADKMSSNILSAMFATIGTFQTAATGQRTKISDSLIQVFDASNVERVRIGVW